MGRRNKTINKTGQVHFAEQSIPASSSNFSAKHNGNSIDKNKYALIFICVLIYIFYSCFLCIFIYCFSIYSNYSLYLFLFCGFIFLYSYFLYIFYSVSFVFLIELGRLFFF